MSEPNFPVMKHEFINIIINFINIIINFIIF